MPRVLRESENNLPFHTPVYKWKKQIVQPQPSHIAATLGPRPGNTLKPPPNNFYLTKWTALEERSVLLKESSKEFQFFSVENQVEQEPEVIAGIDLNEIIKKPGENSAASAAGSPSKVAGSPDKGGPLKSTAPAATGNTLATVSTTKLPLNSPPKHASPQKVAQSPKDQVMRSSSPKKL